MAFSPTQPRVPAGTPNGGEFAGKGGASGSKAKNLTSVAATAGATVSSPVNPLAVPPVGKKGSKSNPIQMDEGPRPGSAELTYRNELQSRTAPMRPKDIAAVEEFTGGDYAAMRKEDRANVGSERVDDLYFALDSVPKYDGMMYRGMSALKQADYDKLLSPDNDEITLDAVASFSRSERVAVDFSNETVTSRGVVLRIQSKTGRQVEHLSSHIDEREVIGVKNTTYRITKKYYGMYKANTVHPSLVIEAQEV